MKGRKLALLRETVGELTAVDFRLVCDSPRRIDADYGLNDANENAAPAFLRPTFEGDRARLKPCIDDSRFLPFDPTSSPA